MPNPTWRGGAATTCNRTRLTTLVSSGRHAAAKRQGAPPVAEEGVEEAVPLAPVPAGPAAPAPLFTLEQLQEVLAVTFQAAED